MERYRGCNCDACQIRRAEDDEQSNNGVLPTDELPDDDPSNGAEADVMHPFITDDGDK